VAESRYLSRVFRTGHAAPGRTLVLVQRVDAPSLGKPRRIVTCAAALLVPVALLVAAGWAVGSVASAAPFPAPGKGNCGFYDPGHPTKAGEICYEQNIAAPWPRNQDYLGYLAGAEDAQPGTTIKLDYYNASCAENVPATVSVEATSGVVKTAGTIPASPPGYGEVSFPMPNVGQGRNHHPVAFVLSYRGPLVSCQLPLGSPGAPTYAVAPVDMSYYEFSVSTCGGSTRVTSSAAMRTRGSSPSAVTNCSTCDPATAPVGRVTFAPATIPSFEIQTYSLGQGLSKFGGPGTGKSAIQDFSFTKSVDASSQEISKRAASGKHFTSATIQIYRQCTTKVIVTFTLEGVDVASYSVAGGVDNLRDDVVLRPDHMQIKYTPQR
jgi:type VI secretion system (T6SS) effector Hcp